MITDNIEMRTWSLKQEEAEDYLMEVRKLLLKENERD